MRRVLVPATCAVTMAVGAPAVHAHAAAVQCGQTITHNLVLDADLTCTGDGLKLAPGVRVDLGGHTLSGPRSGTGITLPKNGDSTISNGTIRYWAHGLLPAGPYAAHRGTTTVSGLVVINNDHGIELSRTRNNPDSEPVLNVTDSTFVNNAVALYIEYTRLTMRSTYIKAARGNTVGVDSFYSRVSIYHSIFQSVGGGVSCVSNTQCNMTTSVVRDGYFGVATQDYPRQAGHSVKLWANRFTRLKFGVEVGYSYGTVRVANNRFRQVGVGVTAENAPLQLVGNDMALGKTGLRLLIDRLWTGPTPGTIAGNTANGYTDGLVVDAPADRAAGIGVQDNAANDNADYGIDAPGVTDLGGNTASGNGHNPQCVGVVCS